MSENLIMVDFASSDPRSISAMLRNQGDGRQQLWLDYEKSHPEIFDQSYLIESFEYKVGRQIIRANPPSQENHRRRLMLLILGILFVLF